MKDISGTLTLNNGVEMPQFGLGVYKVDKGLQIENTVKDAINIGYRLIDTAAFYENEEGVGKAIKESGVPREELFITTKVWNTDQGYDQTLNAFNNSLKKMELDYIDLYLIHWPVKEKYLETWRALEKLYKDGKARAIGVSNFQIHHLKDILENSSEKPAVNQVELHPLLSQKELRAFCGEHNIKVQAWSPIARGRVLEDSDIKEIAKRRGKSAAQIILRWHLQNGIMVIPKSVKKDRLRENADIFDFELTEDEMRQMNELNSNQRFGADPDNFDF
ncbi:glyoxal reductase [Cytobacillus firmus]|uniref:aldo/keto reductase n=1 Tax=Cytobacillus firmus TaxID=1399 RepID=UPI00077C43DA|nr:aldo/keto reductase [Cytobacillus firmus]MBG9543479.1 glyoxal reductase [Cytobacillus firmus]MBG9548266.1 glyoxal reductase [Cytobacillus firmus]MBG9550801.1 glyoxal reductase [Cytobacillus firmus]MBG9556279.1 glyoxal reductase [Cytobacillus firmus]MBG9576410.1 glyoxal reductase [Cytobacillus firmus]